MYLRYRDPFRALSFIFAVVEADDGYSYGSAIEYPRLIRPSQEDFSGLLDPL